MSIAEFPSIALMSEACSEPFACSIKAATAAACGAAADVPKKFGNPSPSLSEPKKVKSRLHGPGLELRRGLLRAVGFSEAAVNAAPPKGAAADDLLDALACAATARRIHSGLAQPFPDPPQRDNFGLAMAIWT